MYIEVNQIGLFYEKAGTGPPIILLHGNGEDHRIFDVLMEQLSADYTVYAIDSRDHGKSDSVSELNYIDMMQDILLFIEAMKLSKPALYGFSDGGIVGILLAAHHPLILSKLIISGANLRPEGMKSFFMFPMRIAHFFSRNQKLNMMLTQPNINTALLSKITIPTLVLAGEKDLVKESHTKTISGCIAQSRLKILKDETHGSYVVHSKKLYPIIKPFLDERTG